MKTNRSRASDGPRRRRALALSVVLALAVVPALTGCSTPAPATGRPTLPDRFAGDPSADAAASAFDEHWWQALGDPVLEALVAQAGQRNLDWRVALTRVEQARAGTVATSSRLAPTVNLTGSASQQSSGLPDEIKRGQPDVRALRGAFELSWEIDLFGAARAAREAATADAQASVEAARAARTLAAAETARQYIAWQGARARLTELESLLRSQEDTERLTRRRAAAGQASAFDVARAAAEVRTLAAQLPPLRAGEAAAEHQIALLLGLPASQPVAALTPARTQPPRLPAVPALAPGQPPALLLRRPDVAAAERQLAADDARLRESQADRLPRLFLSALLGRQDLSINGLDLSPVAYRSVATAFAWPIFNAGRLKAFEERAAARRRGTELQLERTALGALQEVESSLVLLQRERERAEPLAALRDERARAVRHAESLRREGQIDLLQLLDAQRGLIAAELDAIDHRTRLAQNALQLYRALGGGWSLDAAPIATIVDDAAVPPIAATAKDLRP